MLHAGLAPASWANRPALTIRQGLPNLSAHTAAVIELLRIRGLAASRGHSP